MSELLTVAEFKAKYRIGHTTFYRQVAAGRLRLIKIGKSTRISAQDADAWLNALPKIGGQGN